MEFFCTFQIVNFTFNTFNTGGNKNESGYTCRVQKIIYNPVLKSIEINGIHTEGMSNEDVVGLSMKNLKLKGIPALGLIKQFPNLKFLQFDKCGLEKLTKRDLMGFDHIRGLWLPNNNIVCLEDGLFENVQGIRYLCFFRNCLKYIDPNVLTPLKNLTDANFQQNTCINKIYQNGNKEQYDELIKEIIVKCQKNVEMDSASASNLEMITLRDEIKRLKEQNAILQTRVKMLEEKNENSKIIARLECLEQVFSDFQIRLSSLDGYN